MLYCGATDLPLSPAGESEIMRFKEHGIYPPAEVFFTSGLIRTTQTLQLIYGSVESAIVIELAELNFGLYEMKSYDEIKDEANYRAWIMDATGEIQCPNGESKNQFERRVMNGCNRIIMDLKEYRAGSAAVICHGGVIAHVMSALVPGERDIYEWLPKPGRGFSLTFDDALATLLRYKAI
jgi:alpha-ribazole phosphatase